MKTLTLTALLLTAACGSTIEATDNTPITTSPVSTQSTSTVCAWINPEYDFHTYDSSKAVTPPGDLARGLYWKVTGEADSTTFTLYVTVDNNNIPWVSVISDGSTNQVACPDGMTVGTSTLVMESLANGYLIVNANNADGTTRQYMAVAGQ